MINLPSPHPVESVALLYSTSPGLTSHTKSVSFTTFNGVFFKSNLVKMICSLPIFTLIECVRLCVVIARIKQWSRTFEEEDWLSEKRSEALGACVLSLHPQVGRLSVTPPQALFPLSLVSSVLHLLSPWTISFPGKRPLLSPPRPQTRHNPRYR